MAKVRKNYFLEEQLVDDVGHAKIDNKSFGSESNFVTVACRKLLSEMKENAIDVEEVIKKFGDSNKRAKNKTSEATTEEIEKSPTIEKVIINPKENIEIPGIDDYEAHQETISSFGPNAIKKLF